MKRIVSLILTLGLTACVSGTGSSGGGAALLRPSTEAAAVSARTQISNRTFLASPGGGNLGGTIYFSNDGRAIQAAEGQGTEKLTWAIETGVSGINGPALCLVGRFYNIVTNPEAVEVLREGGKLRCVPVKDFVAVKSFIGNGFGLGTIIR